MMNLEMMLEELEERGDLNVEIVGEDGGNISPNGQ